MQWNNEILAETRMKSAEADEIFAEAQMKLNPSLFQRSWISSRSDFISRQWDFFRP